MKKVTRVYFARVEGQLTAFFPDVPSDVEGRYITSYAHIGQHASAHKSHWIRHGGTVEPCEVKTLLAELVAIGYDDLELWQIERKNGWSKIVRSRFTVKQVLTDPKYTLTVTYWHNERKPNGKRVLSKHSVNFHSLNAAAKWAYQLSERLRKRYSLVVRMQYKSLSSRILQNFATEGATQFSGASLVNEVLRDFEIKIKPYEG